MLIFLVLMVELATQIQEHVHQVQKDQLVLAAARAELVVEVPEALELAPDLMVVLPILTWVKMDSVIALRGMLLTEAIQAVLQQVVKVLQVPAAEAAQVAVAVEIPVVAAETAAQVVQVVVVVAVTTKVVAQANRLQVLLKLVQVQNKLFQVVLNSQVVLVASLPRVIAA